MCQNYNLNFNIWCDIKVLIDEKARSAAIDIEQSIILQAPAGSGKTSLLVKRFINLLRVCKDPEECLAITFTKKAAFEMRDRVLLEIEQIVHSKEHTSHNIYNQILANPNTLQILTIDAWCARLTQKMPILSKIGVDLKVSLDPAKLYIEAVDRFLMTLESGEFNHSKDNLIKLLQHLANDHELIKNLLVDMLAKREQWLPLIVPIKVAKDTANISGQDFNFREILENNLQLATEEILADLLLSLPTDAEQKKIIDLAKYAANNIDDLKNNISYCKNLTNNWPQAKCKDLPVWRGLTELLLSKDGKPRRVVNANQGFLAASYIKNPEQKKVANQLKSSMHELLQQLSEYNQNFLVKLQQINTLPDLHYSSENWDVLQSLFPLLPELVAHLMVVFEELQEVDFTQIAIAALQSLGTESNPTDLALFLDHKLNHILVDEFQDTSVLQFNMLEKLVANWQDNDGRTIFVVGDPMQSIYRFRQANVGLFLRVQLHGIANIKLKNLHLKTNFRSSNAIVDNLNKLFCKIFPLKNDIILGGVSYSSAVAAGDNAAIDDAMREVIQFFVTDNMELEAENIVELIKKNKQHDPASSIAILVRARSHATFIIKKLRDCNIPYQATDLESLSNQPVICDLISLTRAILHVQDTIAWLSVLRGPLVGLNLFDLDALSGDARSNSLFHELQNYKNNQQLSSDAMLRLDYILPILLDAINQRETVNLSKLIKKTWLKLGGDLFLSTVELDLAEDFFHKLLEIKDLFQIGAVEELIEKHFVSSHMSQINLNSVQLMTIHKAKGLEFDVVIVPSMDKSPKTSGKQLFLWEERTCFVGDDTSTNLLNNYLLFAPIKSAKQPTNDAIYNFMKYSEEQRELYEAKRLLYVAITRAKKKFYGFGCREVGRNKSFFKFIEPYLNSELQTVLINNNLINNKNDSDSELEATKSNFVLYRIPNEWYIKQIK